MRQPPARGVLRWVLLVLAIPVAAQLILVAAGAADLAASLCCIAVEILAGLGLGLFFRRDVERLGRLLGGDALETPRLAALQRVAIAASQRIAEAQGEEARFGRLLGAEAAIIDRLPEALVMVRADGSIERTNRAARQGYGENSAAVLRHPLLRGAIDRARATGEVQTADLFFAAPMPREIHAMVTPMAPADPGGGVASVLLVDRTRERAVERMRADFVANASHELRTPLASLIGFIETLQGPARDDPPAQERFLEIMAREAARMNRLIDDLLSLSRIELSEHQAPQGRIDLRELIPRILAGFEPRIAARGIRIELTLPDLPPVPGDADQMSQVLSNLLDNALKYGREGGIVGLSVEQVSGAPWPRRPGVAIVVSDDGAGIARVHLARLTERFYRVDKGRSRAIGGTGLGLAIVKHIVNRHRGQLLIASEEGQGSRFSVWLPQ
jgi:two-component system, OmpR family, phosphate regulon sensor histidine kinase PhoR